MMDQASDTTYAGGPVFDGSALLHDHAVRCIGGQVAGVVPRDRLAGDEQVVDLCGDILSLGYVDLQVNGGDGVMFNDDPSVATLTRIAQAHRRLGAAWIMPTLITDTPDKTRAAIDAAIQATRAGVPGIAGLHLEGPHLSVARKGAHDPALIRPMADDDLAALIDAARALPALMVTIAPEGVTAQQVALMAQAGITVSLGHSDADFATCTAYAEAGARCVTHLFNAMSQLTPREPGLVGAALHCGGLSAGLIADGVHVHPATIRAAYEAKTGPGRVFLVSDAMAVAGTDQDSFLLEGRTITRRNGRLTLADGTLAGADLDLTTAMRVLQGATGIAPEIALAATTTVPARLIGLEHGQAGLSGMPVGHLIRIAPDFRSATPVCSTIE